MELETRQEHRSYLEKSFSGKVELRHIQEPFRSIAEKYGPWLDALSKGYLEPITEAQKQFISLFRNGGTAKTKFELTWVLYRRAEQYEQALTKQGVDYSSARAIMVTLAKRRFEPAINWLEREGPWQDTRSHQDKNPLGYRRVDWDNVDALTRFLPGSAGSKG